jgi:hypothetical protein
VGIYTVTVTDVGGCTSTQSVEINYPLGYKEQFYQFLQVYPNPANYALSIDCQDPINTIQMLNAIGQTVLQHTFTPNTHANIAVGDIAEGVYTLVVNGGYKTVVRISR